MIQPSPPHPVVACWSGPESQAAVDVGLTFAQALRQPLVLATAYHYAPTALTADLTQADANQHRRDDAAAALKGALAEAVGDVAVSIRPVPALATPDALRALAREVDASMLVVARDRPGRHLVRQVMRHTPCPIAVADPGAVATFPVRIGVAYDDSDPSRTAVRVARHLASFGDAHVDLLCVGCEPGPWPRLVESGAALCLDAAPVRLDGDPVASLRRAASDVDLLVCGTHARGRLGTAVLGSVSTALAEDCPGNLLIVPAPARRRTAMPLGVTTAAC